MQMLAPGQVCGFRHSLISVHVGTAGVNTGFCFDHLSLRCPTHVFLLSSYRGAKDGKTVPFFHVSLSLSRTSSPLNPFFHILPPFFAHISYFLFKTSWSPPKEMANPCSLNPRQPKEDPSKQAASSPLFFWRNSPTFFPTFAWPFIAMFWEHDNVVRG